MSAPKCLVYLKLARTEWLPSLSTKRTQPGTTSWPLLAVCVRPRLLQAVPSCPCCCLHRPACTGPARRRCPWCCPLPASALSHQPRVSGLSEPQLGTQQSWTSHNSLYLNTWPSPFAGPHAPRQVGGATRVMKKNPPLVLEREVQARARRVWGGRTLRS